MWVTAYPVPPHLSIQPQLDVSIVHYSTTHPRLPPTRLVAPARKGTVCSLKLTISDNIFWFLLLVADGNNSHKSRLSMVTSNSDFIKCGLVNVVFTFCMDFDVYLVPITKVENITQYFGSPGDLAFQWAVSRV